MSNDQKAQGDGNKGPQPIRVRELRFHSDNPHSGVNLGPPFTQNGATHVVQARKNDTDEVRIQFEPWLRRHRVSWFRHGKLDEEVFIPESWASYREER